MSSPHLKAVIFDIGGVVVRSPLLAIASYEKEMRLPPNYVNCSIARRAPRGAWQQFERGELALLPFYEAFGRELSDTAQGNIWYAEYCRQRGIDYAILPEKLYIDGRELFGRMMRESTVYDEAMVLAIHKLREGRWRIIALTNNYAKLEEDTFICDAALQNRQPRMSAATEREFLGWTEGATPPAMRALFDDFCDSSTLGMRKPDPAFYLLACERNGVRPEECVFLDDIGMNLKAARQLGMETIHVPIGGSLVAIRELERKLGVTLTGAGGAGSPVAKM